MLDNINPNTIRVKYRFGNNEFEAEGNTHAVQEHTEAFLTVLNAKRKNRLNSNEIQTNLGQLPLFESETPSLAGDGVYTTIIGQVSDGKSKSKDLNQLYHELPKTHKMLILAVLSIRQDAVDGLSYDDIMAAIDTLKREGIDAPNRATIAARMTDLIDAKLAYKPNDKHRYAITTRGIAEIDKNTNAA